MSSGYPDLKGKHVFVTGGSRGIGKVICSAFAEAGAHVAFSYRTQEDEAKEVLGQLSRLGVEAKMFQLDVRDRSSVNAACTAIETEWGTIDVLVNNAGVNNPTDFDQISDEAWDEVLSVNLKGPFVVTQEMLPLLKKSQVASVIQIGSVSGQYGGPRTAHYAASKAGLISLSQVIARFGAEHNIRSNTVAAGVIASDMGAAGLQSPVVAKAAESILLKRLGTFDEVARAVLFLASEQSSYITAQTINVNGGLYF